jgi:REP element-mobilizing transposase RayT
VREALDNTARAAEFDILGACIMPDHLHALVLGQSEAASLIRLAQRFKQRTGHRWRGMDGTQLWQQSFYDHAVRNGEDVLPIARYVLDNPVEAGLCQDALSWPFTWGTLIAKGASDRDWDAAKATSLRPAMAKATDGARLDGGTEPQT